MPNPLFFDCVSQAVELGYTRFDLTPSTGDVFMDKRVFEKFAYLDAHPGADEYSFFTNLTIPKPETLAKLVALEKLRQLTISVYGHDLRSFVVITKSTGQLYRRLVANLDALLALKDQWKFGVAVGFRSTFDVPDDDASELLRALRRYREAGVPVRPSHGVYNNRGGYITQGRRGWARHAYHVHRARLQARRLCKAFRFRSGDGERRCERVRLSRRRRDAAHRGRSNGPPRRHTLHPGSEYRRSRQPMQTLEQFKEKLGQLHQPR